LVACHLLQSCMVLAVLALLLSTHVTSAIVGQPANFLDPHREALQGEDHSGRVDADPDTLEHPVSGRHLHRLDRVYGHGKVWNHVPLLLRDLPSLAPQPDPDNLECLVQSAADLLAIMLALYPNRRRQVALAGIGSDCVRVGEHRRDFIDKVETTMKDEFKNGPAAFLASCSRGRQALDANRKPGAAQPGSLETEARALFQTRLGWALSSHRVAQFARLLPPRLHGHPRLHWHPRLFMYRQPLFRQPHLFLLQNCTVGMSCRKDITIIFYQPPPGWEESSGAGGVVPRGGRGRHGEGGGRS